MSSFIFIAVIIAGLSSPVLSTNIIFMLMDDVSIYCADIGAAIIEAAPLALHIYIFGGSLGEPQHVRSTVKSVFLLACMLVTGPYMVECKPKA